jgi:hypothetical protein
MMADELIRVEKAGETLFVHLSCLAAHKAAGWVISAIQDPEPQPKRARKPKDIEVTNG